MAKGKRYEGGTSPKLNMKKVLAVIIALAVIIMAIVGIGKMIATNGKLDEKNVANAYFPVYTDGKWGVINSKGEIILTPEYEEAIIIPDNTKDVFLCTYDVNYENNTYKTVVYNSKKQEIITGYDTVTPLENYGSSNTLWYGTDVLLVSKEGKYGLVDFNGKELLACEYDSIETLKGVKSSFVTKKDGKLGLVDNIGATVLENEYQAIKPVSDKYENGYIVTNADKKMGVMAKGKTLVEVKYEDIKSIYGDGKYIVKEEGKWQLIDTEGNIYLKDQFDEVITVHGENVILQKDKKYGVSTLSGETEIEPKYEEMSYSFDNNYIYKENGKYGIMNIEGQVLLNPEYDTLIYRAEAGFFEGTKNNSANTDFIAQDIEVKVSGILSELNITNGYMKIRTEGEYKYYNFKFEEKTSRELLTTNTLFLDKKDGKYGYINKAGVVVVDYIYDDAREQNEYGYSSVKKNGMCGCIDSKGKEVITPAYQLENSAIIEFINKWHRGEDLNLNYYTDQ